MCLSLHGLFGALLQAVVVVVDVLAFLARVGFFKIQAFHSI